MGMTVKEEKEIRANFCEFFKFCDEISGDFFQCKQGTGKELKGDTCRQCKFYKYQGLKAYCFHKH